MTFEEKVTRLEQIAAALSAEDVDLTAALALFEEGVALVREAAAELGTARGIVQQLNEKLDGTFELADLNG